MNIAQRTFFIIFSLATFGAALLTVYTCYLYFQQKQRIHFDMKEANKESLDAIISFFEKKLSAITNIAVELDTSDILLTSSRDQVEEILKNIMKKHDTIYGIGIAFEPYAYDKNERFVSMYFMYDRAREIVPIDIQKYYDYTKTLWYTDALKNTNEWVGPYTEAATNTIITRYAQALTIGEGDEKKIYGVLTIDTSIGHLNDNLASLNIHKDSYALITGKNGILIAHPTEHYVQEAKTIFDLAQLPGQRDFITLGNKIKTTNEGELALYDTKIGKKYHAIYKHIPDTKWTVIVITSEKHELIYSTAIRRIIINAMFSFFLFLFFVSTLIAQLYTDIRHKLWFIVIVLSILLGLSIGMLWVFDAISTESVEFHEHVVNNQMAVSRFFYLQKRLNPSIYKKDVHFIPTGLFIYSIDLPAIDPNVTLNGHIWQKYNLKKDKDLANGVTILNAKDQSFEKIYEVKDIDTYTIGWRFKATVKNNFIFTKFPFDQQNIALVLAHQDYKANIILVPDFESFSIKTSTNTEIDSISNTGKWTTKNSYSFYQLTDYITNFGIDDYTKQKNFPNLCFNILVRRNFSDPLITNFLPILIIIVIAFMTLVVAGLSNERTKDIAALVLPLCSSIFFAAVIGHQTYERTLEFVGITYFEYFYFMVYIIILLTTINGMLYGYHRGGWLITYQKNFIPRLLYWPIVLFAFLINTIIFFY